MLADLISTASMNRADLVAAMKNKEVASRALKATRRERNTDVDLSIAVSKNARVHNEEAPAPPFTGVTAGIAIPLKFSNFNKGTVRAAVSVNSRPRRSISRLCCRYRRRLCRHTGVISR